MATPTKNTTVTFSAQYKDFDKAKGIFDKLGLAFKTFVKSATGGGDYLKDISKPIGKQSRDIESNMANLPKYAKQMNNLGKAVNGGTLALKGLFALGAYIGLDKVFSGFAEFHDNLYEIQKEAHKLGMSTEGLSRFQYTVRQLGGDASEATKALGALFELSNNANMGDPTAMRIMQTYDSNAKVNKLQQAPNMEYEFENFRKSLLQVRSTSEKAAKALLVLGDDAFGVSHVLADGKMGNYKGIKDEAATTRFLQDLDLNKIKYTMLQFDSIMNQLKTAFVVLWSKIAGTFVGNDWEKWIADLPALLEQAVHLVRIGFVELSRWGLIAARSLMQFDQWLQKIPTFWGDDPVKGATTPEDLKWIQGLIDEKNQHIEKLRIAQPNEMVGNHPFNLLQKANQEMVLAMMAMRNTALEAKNVIGEMIPPSEKFQFTLTKLNRMSKLGLLDQGTYLRALAKTITDAESAMGMYNLSLPKAAQMNTAETENLISQIGMERQVKDRDPIKRLENVNKEMLTVQQQQLSALEGLANVPLGQLLGWK